MTTAKYKYNCEGGTNSARHVFQFFQASGNKEKTIILPKSFLYTNGALILTGIMKARVFPDPVFAAPRTSRPHNEWGREALCISVITLYLAPFNPSLVFFDNGNWPNSEHPAYRENKFPSSLPIWDLGGNGGRERGFEPLSGFPKSIHDLSSSISSTSNCLFCLRRWTFLDLGFLMLEIETEREGDRVAWGAGGWRKNRGLAEGLCAGSRSLG